MGRRSYIYMERGSVLVIYTEGFPHDSRRGRERELGRGRGTREEVGRYESLLDAN